MSEVKGIGEGAPEGWVLEEYEIPMPKGLSEILEAVKHVLKQGRVQTVSLKINSPIRFTRFVEEKEASQKRKSEEEGLMELGEVVRNIPMEEFSSPRKSTTASEALLDMMLMLEARRLHLTHIGVGPETRLFEWLGIDKVAYGGMENLGGAALVVDKSVPEDVILLLGGPYRHGRIDQATLAVKNHMFVPGEDLLTGENDGQEAKR